MNIATLLCALSPWVGTGLIGWLFTLVIIIVCVACLIWVVTRLVGPPNLPEPVKWIVWGIVILVILAAALHLLGVGGI